MAVGGFFQGIDDMSGAVQGFRAATAAGFTISREGGAALLAAISTMLAALEQTLADSAVLSQEPPLGTTPAAKVYRPFLATIASDPAQGFFPAVRKLQQDLNQLADDVRRSMGVYRSTDDGSAHDLNSAGGPTAGA
ncbi:hypothetical protein [Actinosynnema sp. NPDC023587]|uniref:hypothetical protein n=1 Tax=Actinosynnema sp. NPDC023587 TaxID=3154695 RepID=UPI0033F58E52